MAGTRSSARRSRAASDSPGKLSGSESSDLQAVVPSTQTEEAQVSTSRRSLKSKLRRSNSKSDESQTSENPERLSTPPLSSEASIIDEGDRSTVVKGSASASMKDSETEKNADLAPSPVLVDDDGLQLALQESPRDIADPTASVDGDDDVVDGDDWVAEEKKLREENRRRQEEERKQSKKLSSREKVQLLDNLLQKAAAYSAFLRGRMQEAVSMKTESSRPGHPERDPRQPSLVSGAVMRRYQVEGVLWMASLYENGLNGILADEMGLGKTLQTIAFIAHLYEMKVFGPFLIVAPLSTIQNWNREFARFAPSISTVVYHGSKEDRKEMRDRITEKKGQDYPVVITSFEVAMNDAKLLARFPRGGSWKYLVVDEGHRLKNKDCRLLRELKSLPTDNRLLLSGTPLQNNLTELWSLLNFILPTIFTDLSTFQNWFDFEDDLNSGEGASERIIAEEQAHKTISKLHTILDPFLLRRLKNDVELGLPDKREYLIYAPWTSTQLKINRAIADRKLAELCTVESSAGFKPGADGSWAGAECVENVNEKATSLQNILMQMRKCCNHPYLFQAPKDPAGNIIVDDRLIHAAGKLQLLDRILPVLKAGKHKVLIFCQMTIMLDLLEDYLEYRHYRCDRIDGTVPWRERQERMDSFNGDEDSFIFLLSTRAGGIGINLVAADTVIFYDSDWNPQQDLQAQDRCHRIGQTKPVLVLRLLTTDSVESHIYDRACGKRKLELVAIARKRFKVADKVEHGAKIEDLQAAGKDKKGFVAQVRESLSAEELTELLRRRSGGDTCKQDVINEADLKTLLLVRKRGEGVADEGRGWMCVSFD